MAERGSGSGRINNAGVHLKKYAVETSDGEFARVIQTLVMGAFSLRCEAGRRILKWRNGRILFMASTASFTGVPKVVAYAAAKFFNCMVLPGEGGAMQSF